MTDLTIVVTPPAPLNVEITPAAAINVELLAGFGVPVNVGGGGGGSLTVREADGNPTGTVTEIVFPNGTVSIGGATATITGLQGPQGIQGPPGPNAINVNTATTFDGVLLGDGAGVYAELLLPIAFGGTGAANAAVAATSLLVLSFGSAQELTLAQLRTARRNQLIGSAPTAAYDGNGRLSTLTYSDGSVKTFTYTGNQLTQSDHVYTSPARTYRKVFSYDGNGRFQSITETIF